MKIEYVNAWSCGEGEVCEYRPLSCLHPPDPACRHVRCYDEQTARLMERAVELLYHYAKMPEETSLVTWDKKLRVWARVWGDNQKKGGAK